ncbi:hypothetical protein [Desertivirga xinjiangensis]|uniref:hypothetical protein n=1 Tax=Desertivirga xinjiangensis TaxID=539206 RepID=UPI002109669E|nr:hypothetical protein [Pedobacter xinjiangensis]
MKFRFYRESAVISLKEQSSPFHAIFIGITVVIGILSVLIIPGWFSLALVLTAACVSAIYLRAHFSKRPLALAVTKDGISYYNEDLNEIITIAGSDIHHINTNFCRIQISTRDNHIHNISLMDIKSPQTRWEIKEFTRSFTCETSGKAFD